VSVVLSLFGHKVCLGVCMVKGRVQRVHAKDKMLSELSEDNLDTISDHLNLASGLRLASIAKSMLGLKDRLHRRADVSAKKIQRTFRRHYCWPLGLRAMAKTLNPAAVAFQSQRAKATILARFEGLTEEETSEQNKAASMQMQMFVKILHEVCAETLPPLPAWKQNAAAACVDELIYTLLELGEEVVKLIPNWDDQGQLEQVVGGQYDLFVCKFPSGDEIVSLMVYLAQMKCWNGWCCRGEHMMSVILEECGILGCALTFFSLHGWDYTDLFFPLRQIWDYTDDLDTSSMYQNAGTLAIEVELEDGPTILHDDPNEMLALLSHPDRVHCPLKRGLFQAMSDKRKAMLSLQSTEEEANELTMQAAYKFIEMHTDRC